MGKSLLIKVEKDYFSKTVGATYIGLSFSYFIIFDPDSFVNCINLENLALHHNEIEVLPAGLFRKNVNLKKITLYDNYIKTLPSTMIEGLTKLNLLYLRGNRCINEDFLNVLKDFEMVKNAIIVACSGI